MSKWTSTLATENLTERQRRNNNGINTVIIPNNYLLAAFNAVLHCYVHICVCLLALPPLLLRSLDRSSTVVLLWPLCFA